MRIRNEESWSMTEERLTPTQIEVPRWTAEEFERLVFDCKPKVAVFDCDGTLWSGDAGYEFMVWSLEQGLVSRSTGDWIDNRHRAYRAGKVSEVEICGEMVQMYAGLRDHELRAAAAEYIQKFVKPRVFPEMAALLSNLRHAGVEIWAVSSTNKWVIAEGVRDLLIPEDHILAAEVRVDSGIIISDLVDVPTDNGKAAALARIGQPNPDAVFGNSIHDLAMLEIAHHAFPVNPSPALLAAAAKRGWGHFMPHAADGTEDVAGGEEGHF
jgi:phosphoserine phosphatase